MEMTQRLLLPTTGLKQRERDEMYGDDNVPIIYAMITITQVKIISTSIITPSCENI